MDVFKCKIEKCMKIIQEYEMLQIKQAICLTGQCTSVSTYRPTSSTSLNQSLKLDMATTRVVPQS